MQTTTEFVHSKSTRFIHGISAILILGLFGIGTAMVQLEYIPPIGDGHSPFFFDIHYCEVDGFLSCLIIYELDLGFGVFADTPIQIFNSIGCIDDFADLQREVKITGQVGPVPAPGVYRIPVFGPPY